MVLAGAIWLSAEARDALQFQIEPPCVGRSKSIAPCCMSGWKKPKKPNWRQRKQRNKARKPPEARQRQQMAGERLTVERPATRKREWWNSVVVWFGILCGF